MKLNCSLLSNFHDFLMKPVSTGPIALTDVEPFEVGWVPRWAVGSIRVDQSRALHDWPWRGDSMVLGRTTCQTSYRLRGTQLWYFAPFEQLSWKWFVAFDVISLTISSCRCLNITTRKTNSVCPFIARAYRSQHCCRLKNKPQNWNFDKVVSNAISILARSSCISVANWQELYFDVSQKKKSKLRAHEFIFTLHKLLACG